MMWLLCEENYKMYKKSINRTTKKQMVGLCTDSFIDTKLKTGKRCQKTELTGRCPLIRRRSTLDCSAV